MRARERENEILWRERESETERVHSEKEGAERETWSYNHCVCVCEDEGRERERKREWVEGENWIVCRCLFLVNVRKRENSTVGELLSCQSWSIDFNNTSYMCTRHTHTHTHTWKHVPVHHIHIHTVLPETIQEARLEVEYNNPTQPEHFCQKYRRNICMSEETVDGGCCWNFQLDWVCIIKPCNSFLTILGSRRNQLSAIKQ